MTVELVQSILTFNIITTGGHSNLALLGFDFSRFNTFFSPRILLISFVKKA